MSELIGTGKLPGPMVWVGVEGKTSRVGGRVGARSGHVLTAGNPYGYGTAIGSPRKNPVELGEGGGRGQLLVMRGHAD